MVKREGQVDKDLVGGALGLVVLLDNVVDVLCIRAPISQSSACGGDMLQGNAIHTVTAELTKRAKTKAAEEFRVRYCGGMSWEVARL